MSLSSSLTAYVLPLARFDGLSLEAHEPARLAAFWRHNLPGTLHDQGGGHLRLDPADNRAKAEILRLVPAARPGADTDRVHLDIRLPGPGPDHLLAAGAGVIRAPGADPWWVLADPEGNQFCAYPSVDDRPPGVFELVIKSRNPLPLAHWWGRVLGGKVQPEGEAAVIEGTPDFPWDYLVFDPAPETRTGRSRLTWHLRLRDADPHILTSSGATALSRDDHGWLLADPEGNAFHAS